MDLVDVVILYLALGAPFGALHYVGRSRSGPGALASSGLAAAGWIFYLPKVLHTHVESMLSARIFSLHDRGRLDNALASKLCNAMDGHVSGSRVLEIREMVDRYAGLTESISDPGEVMAFQTDLWSAAKIPSPGRAAAIHARTNLAKLKLHREDAAEELLEFARRLDRQTGRTLEARAALRELFLAYGDEEFARSLSEETESGNNDQGRTRPSGTMRWNGMSQGHTNGRHSNLAQAASIPIMQSDDQRSR